MRLIARLDIKNNYLIKSIKYDGVRKIGLPEQYAKKYYEENIDEIFLTNVTGTLYKTKLSTEILKNIRQKVHIPIASGGGIENIEDAESLIKNGSDKVIINSIIHTNIKAANEIIKNIGSSSVVGSIQYTSDKKLLTHYKMGREKTGLNLFDTIKKYNDLGIGEILCTNIGKEGTYSGLDKTVLDIIGNFSSMPILIGGGFLNKDELIHFKDKVSAVVISSSLHYKKVELNDVMSIVS